MKDLRIEVNGASYRVWQDRWKDAAGESVDIVVEWMTPDEFTSGALRGIEIGRIPLLPLRDFK